MAAVVGVVRSEIEVEASKPAHEALAAAFRQAIFLGVYLQGSHLPTERDLAPEFGVSRNTARKALRLLAEEGLVETSRGRLGGSVVTAPTMPNGRTRRTEILRWYERMSDNYAVRRANEPLAARWAAERATTAERRAILKLGKSDCHHGPGYHRLESAWHEMVARAARQPLLADVVTACRSSLFDSVDLRWIPGELLRAHQSLGENFHDFSADHTPIAEAIVDRDGDAAASAMAAHISRWEADLGRIVTLLVEEQAPKLRSAN